MSYGLSFVVAQIFTFVNARTRTTFSTGFAQLARGSRSFEFEVEKSEKNPRFYFNQFSRLFELSTFAVDVCGVIDELVKRLIVLANRSIAQKTVKLICTINRWSNYLVYSFKNTLYLTILSEVYVKPMVPLIVSLKLFLRRLRNLSLRFTNVKVLVLW